MLFAETLAEQSSEEAFKQNPLEKKTHDFGVEYDIPGYEEVNDVVR